MTRWILFNCSYSFISTPDTITWLLQDDEFLDKALEGAVMFALNQGEVCTCPSRMLVHEDIYEKFIALVVERTKKIKIGHPLVYYTFLHAYFFLRHIQIPFLALSVKDPETMIGAQASLQQLDKITSYLNIGKAEGAQVLCGGGVSKLSDDLDGG